MDRLTGLPCVYCQTMIEPTRPPNALTCLACSTPAARSARYRQRHPDRAKASVTACRARPEAKEHQRRYNAREDVRAAKRKWKRDLIARQRAADEAALAAVKLTGYDPTLIAEAIGTVEGGHGELSAAVSARFGITTEAVNRQIYRILSGRPMGLAVADNWATYFGIPLDWLEPTG